MWSSSCPCSARHARPAFVRDADEANAFSKFYRYERRRSGASHKGFQELRHTPGYLMYRGQALPSVATAVDFSGVYGEGSSRNGFVS